MSFSNYPSALDTSSNLPDTITDDSTLASPDHANLHNTISQAAIELETKVGTGTGTVPSLGSLLVGTGSGATDWSVAANLVFNVQTYGAKGNGTTNDTTAIQNTIDAASSAGGGIVWFPTGTYKITAALSVFTGISLVGAGSESSIINQVTTTESGLFAVDAASVTLQGLLIEGPSSGSGVGINFSWTAAGNVPFLDFRDVLVRHFGSDGIAIETPIVSNFTRVVSEDNGGYGLNFYHAGTSCSFNGCWMRGNALAGWHFFESVYMNLSGCASDNNGVGYLIESAQSIGMYACGAESQVIGSGQWDGTAFKISNSSVIGMYNCWVANNVAIGMWITNGSVACEIFGAADNSPAVGATAFVQTDVSTNSTISDIHNTTANSLSAGTCNILNDGANGLRTRTAYVQGANGTLTISSDTDAGQFNINSSLSGTLAVYGQGGQTLNVNLSDGLLQTAGVTRLTNAGLLNNVTLDSAGTGNSLKVNGTTLTAVTGTGSVVLATSPTIGTGFGLNGASGTLSFTAASDGGDYNIFSANGAQTLAVYGSGGNSLGLHLLDGLLTADGGATINGTFTLGDGDNIVAGTTTGTKVGTVGGASGQKLGFFGQTAIVQPLLATGASHTVDNIITVLQNLGLVRQS